MRAARGFPGFPFLVIALSLVPVLGAQTNSASSAANENPSVFVLRKNVRRVIVDVVVRDSSNQPVRGLLAKDFSISEDGTGQHITSFEAHQFDTPSISLPRDAPPLPPNVFVNVPKLPEHGPLYVILYDMVNMEMDDQASARQQVMKFLRTLPEGARFAVYVHSDGLHFVQGFTEDRDLIYAALDPKNPKPHVPMSFLYSRNFNRRDPVAMVSVLTHIGEFLEGIPGKKNLIWMAGTFPVTLYAHEGDPRDLEDDLRAELNALARAEVAVYPVSIRGVIVNPEGALNGAGPHTGVGGVAGGTPGPAGTVNSGVSPVTSSADSVTDDNMMEEDIASATGGRAFYSDNGIKEMLDEAVTDGGNYYTLSYSPSNLNYDGSMRRIKVLLDQHGYHLAYRPSYFADDPDAPKPHKKNSPDDDSPEEMEAKTQERPMFATLQHGAPLVHQLIFKARIHPEGLPRLATAEEMAKLAEQRPESRRKNPKALKPVTVQSYAIYYVVVASQIHVPQDGAIPLEFAAVAYDANGFIANAVVENVVDDSSTNPFAGVQATVPEDWEASSQKVYRAMQELTIPVNATTLRLAVRDTSTDRLGAMEIPLPLAPEPQLGSTNPPPQAATPAGSTKLN